jgi:hypothetical protein
LPEPIICLVFDSIGGERRRNAMATHIRLADGGELVVEGELGEIASMLGSGSGLVALTSSYGGTLYVNPANVLFCEEPPELGLGKPEAEADVEAAQTAPEPSSPPPSQAPPGL